MSRDKVIIVNLSGRRVSVLEYADAAVVCSAIVEVIEEQEGDGTIFAVEAFVRRLLHTN